MEEQKKKRREFYTYTMILCPTLLMAVVSYMENVTYKLSAWAILIFLQGILLKGITEEK